MKIDASQWYYSPEHGQLCRVIETHTLWGETTCHVWLQEQGIIVRIRGDKLKPISEVNTSTSDHITYITAAARIADALTQDVLLAPIESSVIPLPHQINALSRAISNDRVRYLLADEVGLGKTIEAGLIMRELKLRGLVVRTLVIAPKGLVTQWVAEMRTHFGENFRLLIPGDITIYRSISSEDNIWRSHNQVVCPMDSVKPLDSRRGWSREQVGEYNRERFEDLIAAGWDLVIVDEAHRLSGSTEQVARYKLGHALADAAPYLLLLSATPHQGKTDAFHRLVSLIDPEAFPDIESVTKERVQPHVIRSEKRRAITADGKPLFKPRRTQLVTVSWEDRHREQRLLYDAVTEYVRQGYNQAIMEKKCYIGFLMILMQRLVTSSTQAIRTTLERRLDALEMPEEQLTLMPMAEEDWTDMDGQEQVEALLRTRLNALKNEHAEVRLLLEAARRCEQTGTDAKAEALLDWIYRMQQEEGEPDLKVLIFTEFVPTQEMLQRFLSDRGFSVVCLNGSMDMDERIRAQDRFTNKARVMISTDAGGEGLNLQFCHVVINYDIPWNPMRIEQRIGRVDRIGQEYHVRAINFVFQGTVEHRVRQVLEEKLAVILEDFGIDKTGDVLDSELAGKIFDDLYMEAILHPEALDSTVDKMVSQIETQARETHENVSMLSSGEYIDPADARRLISHPLPYWVERMTTNYISAHGGSAKRRGHLWDLTWPDGDTIPNAVFSGKDARKTPIARYLTLEDARVRGLVTRLPLFVPGQPIPTIALPSLPAELKGSWSLWRISIHTDDWSRQRIMPLFIHDDGRVLLPAARHIWDQMLIITPDIDGFIRIGETLLVYAKAMEEAEIHGKLFYDELVQTNRNRLVREREKGEFAFASRRRAVERIGLPSVRNYRLTQLEQEEKTWRDNLKKRDHTIPEMAPLILIRIEGEDTNA